MNEQTGARASPPTSYKFSHLSLGSLLVWDLGQLGGGSPL